MHTLPNLVNIVLLTLCSTTHISLISQEVSYFQLISIFKRELKILNKILVEQVSSPTHINTVIILFVINLTPSCDFAVAQLCRECIGSL